MDYNIHYFCQNKKRNYLLLIVLLGLTQYKNAYLPIKLDRVPDPSNDMKLNGNSIIT